MILCATRFSSLHFTQAPVELIDACLGCACYRGRHKGYHVLYAMQFSSLLLTQAPVESMPAWAVRATEASMDEKAKTKGGSSGAKSTPAPARGKDGKVCLYAYLFGCVRM